MSGKRAKGKVRSITIARLYNLGNYEHVRWEVSIDVDGGSAAAALLDLAGVLKDLRPIKKDYRTDTARATLAKDLDALSESEKERLQEFRELVAEHDRQVEARKRAIEKLDSLGGKSVHKDAKLTWRDDDEDGYF